jgi:cytochrome c oxidase subunit 2
VVRTGDEFTDVWRVYLPIAGGVFLIVLLTLLLFLWRYRQRSNPAREPGTTVEHHLVEGSYVAALVAIVAFLVFWTYLHQNRIDGFMDKSEAAAAPAVSIDVVAAKWTWRFEYRGTHVTQLPPKPGAPTELYVPADSTVHFAGRSQDVLHDFWVPDVRFQRQVWPDHVERWNLVFPEGRHQGVCAWFCGLRHQTMHFDVIALPPDEFQTWLRRRQAQGSRT